VDLLASDADIVCRCQVNRIDFLRSVFFWITTWLGRKQCRS